MIGMDGCKGSYCCIKLKSDYLDLQIVTLTNLLVLLSLLRLTNLSRMLNTSNPVHRTHHTSPLKCFGKVK